MAISLKEIQSDPEFQALPFENRKKVLNGWYRDNVGADAEYQSLPTMEQSRIHRNFEKESSVTPGASGTWGDPSTVDVLKKSIQHVPYSAAQGVGGLGRMLGEAVGSEKIADWGRDVYQGAGIEIQKDMPEIRSGVKQAMYGGVQSLAQNLPGMAASIATGNPIPALASIGALAGGQSYGESREKGVTPGKAALGAIGEGGLEVATEYIPMGYLLKPGLSFAKRTLFSTLSELVGENINTVGQKAVQWWTRNPDKTVGEFVGEMYPGAKQTSLQVLMTSPIMALGAQGAHRALNQTPQIQQPQGKDLLDNLIRQKIEVDLPKGETPIIPQQEVAVTPPLTRRMPGGIRKPVDLLVPQGDPVIEQIPPAPVLQPKVITPPEEQPTIKQSLTVETPKEPWQMDEENIIELSKSVATEKEPLKTVGYRYGDAPEGGYSFNTRENKQENGVSMASVAGIPESRSFATMAAKKRGIKYYEGDVIGYGSDGEPVMINIVPITETNYHKKVLTKQTKYSALQLQAKKYLSQKTLENIWSDPFPYTGINPYTNEVENSKIEFDKQLKVLKDYPDIVPREKIPEILYRGEVAPEQETFGEKRNIQKTQGVETVIPAMGLENRLLMWRDKVQENKVEISRLGKEYDKIKRDTNIPLETKSYLVSKIKQARYNYKDSIREYGKALKERGEGNKYQEVVESNKDIVFATPDQQIAKAYAMQIEGKPEMLYPKPTGYNPSVITIESNLDNTKDLTKYSDAQGVISFADYLRLMKDEFGIGRPVAEKIFEGMETINDTDSTLIYRLLRGDALKHLRPYISKQNIDAIKYLEGGVNYAIFNKSKVKEIKREGLLKTDVPSVQTDRGAVSPPAIQDELLQVAQTENIFKQVKKITSAIKIDKGFLDHFDRTEVRPIAQKSPGLFSTKKGMPLDGVADGLGISTDELANKLRDAVSKKEETESLKKQIEEYRPPTEMVTVGELRLNPGDKFKIHGEQYQVTQRNEEGHLVIKDGITYEVDEFDKIPVPDEGTLKKGKPKFVQPKMFEGEKVDIKPTLDTEVAGQGKLFGTPSGEADYLNRNLSHKRAGNVKAGQLTPEQIRKMTSDVNIGREGKPSIKSDAELRYAPGTGINLETLDLPPDIKHTIYKLTQQYQPTFEEQRNKKTWEEINKEAESSGFNAEQLLERQKGEAYNAAKLKAVKDIQNNTTFEAKRIVDASVKLLNNPLLTDEQQAEILATANLKMKKAAAILAQAGGAYSEAGRALNILRQVTGARKAEKNWKAILDSLGGKEMTLDIFRKISKVDISSVPETAKFIREVQKARTADMVLESWRNAILSGTKTLITNPLSNAITFLSNPVETGIAATIEKVRSTITGKRPQVYFSEVNAEIVGAIDGIWNGMRVFLNTLDTEMSQFGGELKIEQAINQVAIPGKTGRVIRYPQRLLTAQDDLAKAAIYDSTMKAMAVKFAIRKGLKGEKLTEFVGELLTHPQGKNKRIYDLFDKRARAESDYRTYNKALGKIGQMVMNLRDIEFPAGSGVKPLYYVVPFIRTPTNIVKYGLERTPFNFIRVGYQTFKGKIPDSQISEEFAKPIIGTLMFLLTWLLYEYGYITGGAPKDDSDRKTWYAAGKKEYSFYAPWIDRHISYQRIEPLGSILGMSADFFEGIHRGVKNPKDATLKITTSISKNWTNKTFVLGLTNAMNAYTDPERYGDKFVDGLTSSLVPNIISSFNPDPYYRDKDSFLDSIKAKVPGLSETLPPKRDVFGGAAMKGEGRSSALMNQILPFGVTKPTDDPVRMELLRLNDSIDFSVGESPKYFRINKEKINIPPKVYSEYVRESGELAHSIISKTIRSDGYKKATDERRAEKIRNDFDRARNYIRPRYIRQLQQKKALRFKDAQPPSLIENAM